MSGLHDTISPIKRAEIGIEFLKDCRAMKEDVDILVDDYVSNYGVYFDKKVLRNFLENLSELITEVN